MKGKIKQISGSVKIMPEVLEDARAICKKNGWLVSAYITKVVEAANRKQNPLLKERTL